MGEQLDICDDLHGTVHLSETEQRLIDSPWFQRLRRVRQLGLAHMVFPGAEHTRFAHSIGVYHLAQELTKKLESRLRDEDMEGLQELRLAALLHDVGHFPFSHTLEGVYEKAERKQRKSQKKPRRPVAGPMGQARARAPAGMSEANGTASHEQFGLQIIEGTDVPGGITRILRDHFVDPEGVASIVVGKHPNRFLNQVLKSDLDVDQLDYLLRDAKATGSSYGHYDLNYLMECMEVVYFEETPVLCVSMQGLHPLEHYVLARYFYYLCILYQKTRCIAEGMLQSIARELIAMGKLPSWDRISDGVRKQWFCSFDDEYVWACLRSAQRSRSVDPETRDAIGMLLERRLPRVAREEHPTTQGQDKPGGPSRSSTRITNRIARAAAKQAAKARFQILKPAGLPRRPSRRRLTEVLQDYSRPIRILIKDPYTVPAGTPSVPAYDKYGREVGQLTLLETLRGSIVAKMAGWVTHVVRQYKPPQRV